jgi:hypothetical protein
MTTPAESVVTEIDAQVVLARAADAGFRLAELETPAGQTVWEWRRGDEPRPQFVLRRVALHWMQEFLGRESKVAFVSDSGPSIA